MAIARVALLADTYHEVNGAARTCREWLGYARRKGLPFLCVRWNGEAGAREEGSMRTMDLVRSSWAVPVDSELQFDPWLGRVIEPIEAELERFRPDAIHVTSPGDLGIVGAILAARRKTPLAASWHTNLHEFAGRRLGRCLRWLPGAAGERLGCALERFVMGRVCWFFSRGELLFAPNPELSGILRQRTGRPVFPMRRGVDTALFTPARRDRTDTDVVVGFVGRLMPEKNGTLLARVETAWREAGLSKVRFQITGTGSERPWMERNLDNAVFTGVLSGVELARAYANLDIFVFPSKTDTFGNVVQEALASGVPAVVTDAGGPRFIVRHGETGFVAGDDEEFCARVVELARREDLRREMAAAARRQMESVSWDGVFAEVYRGYASRLGSA
ncbi:MAG: glycosyltransferase [Bryobacteraceae bacterium]|jgi:glycosyltransferase involved in cell wall biosynthesis